MSSGFSDKLQTRLKALTINASRESILALSKWMVFNRRHANAFCSSLLSILQETTEVSRKILYLKVMNEILVMESSSGDEKWKRLAEFRTLLGEKVIVPCIRSIKDGADNVDTEDLEKVSAMVDDWEEADSFGSPITVSEARRILEEREKIEVKSEEPSSKEERIVMMTDLEEKGDEGKTETMEIEMVDNTSSIAAAKVEHMEEKQKVEVTSPVTNEAEASAETDNKTDQPQKVLNDLKAVSSAIAADFEFDFDKEGQGIEFRKVPIDEFIEPCKSISTLQIAREIRSDSTSRLWNTLQSLPPEAEELAKKKQEDPLTPIHPNSKALLDIPDDILDLDVEEALQEVKQLRDTVRKQMEARQTCANLLIQCRCQFGSKDAAEAFYAIRKELEELKKQKEELADAMALEGLDMDEEANEENDAAGAEEDLEDFDWYTAPDLAKKPCIR